MTREAFEDVARRQDEYLRDKDVIVIDGFIGSESRPSGPGRA